MGRTRVRRLALVGVLGLGVALLSACGGGVSQTEYDTVKQQLAQEQQKAQTYQQQLSSKVQEASTLQKQVAEKDQAVAAKEKALADLQKQAGALQGITVLQSAKQVPTPTPRPTPTPPPPGYTPPPPVRVPAEVANEVIPFAFYVETLITASVSKYGYASDPACVPASVFKRGTKLVWRFEVIETKDGTRLTDFDAPTITINLPDGEKLTPRYSMRAGTGPWTWASGWDIPLDYPLGAFDYSISVSTKDGRSYTWKMPAVVNKERGTDSRVRIIE